MLTLGSLFDGIGAFPYAAERNGILPVWASEIEKYPISITMRHFPNMLHLGDITKLDGGKIPAVHVLTFGSPCQNLSLCGTRTCRREVEPVFSGNSDHTGNEGCKWR